MPSLTPSRPWPAHLSHQSIITRIVIAILWLYVILGPGLGVDWVYYHDTPLLNYAGVLMTDFGMIPYRDIFETTMPGTFLFHYIVVALGLEAQTPFILLGLGAMVLLGLGGGVILWHWDRMAALVFPPFLLLFMLHFGPTALLQREILGLLAMVSAVILATRQNRTHHLWRQGLVGLCFGMACTVKPQFALGAPVVVLCLAGIYWSERSGQGSFARIAATGIAPSIAGFSLPLIVAFIWLWTTGALAAFSFILTEYTPLYIQQTQSHAFTTSEARMAYLWTLWPRFGGFWPLMLAVPILLIVMLGYGRQIPGPTRIVFGTCAALTVIYGLLPALSGQFWEYHYFPFVVFAILTNCALLSCVRAPYLSRANQMMCLICVAVAYFSHLQTSPPIERLNRTTETRMGLALDMERALNTWVPEGGRVQPIDWTAGALHAMLRARVPIATRFFYDFHFAHHVSRDVIQALRQDYIRELTANPPEVLLVALTQVRVHGLDTSYDFPELDAFRDNQYRLVEKNEAFEVYQRQDLAS